MDTYHDYFGEFGGKYVAETLRAPLEELEAAFLSCMADPEFQDELGILLRDFAGRPTPLYHAENASRNLGGAQVYIKLEGLANTGAHKINNVLGQVLLAKRM
ncbi:MAG: tryptophan synthase subunit beta, partial [Bacteroidales bacterium]|nr:tryptophan synthase subunit beta [Bacteroidales bacterium]